MVNRKTHKQIQLTDNEKEKILEKHKISISVLDDKNREILVTKLFDEGLKQKEERTRRNRRNKNRGKSLEKKLAAELGMERVPYSGSNKAFGWGDIKSDYLLGEAKSITPKTGQKNIIIFKKDIDDITRQAREQNKMPWYAARLVGHNEIYVTMNMADWLILMQAVGLLKGWADINISSDGRLFINDLPYNEYILKKVSKDEQTKED